MTSLARKLLLIPALAMALAAPAFAADAMGPEQLVKQTTHDVLQVLEAHKEEIHADPSKVSGYVRDLVLPHFDFELMSRFVLARAWKSASDKQRKAFTQEFKQLLIRTYGKSLAEYSGQKVDFPPMQSDPSRGRVTVPTEVEQPDGPTIPIDYSLYKTDSGKWKVFDVNVDGVSLVQNYRSSFASKVDKSGLDGLIEELHQRNAERSGGAD